MRMLLPIQVTFREVQPSDAVADYVHKRAQKLTHVFDRISTCRVVVEGAHQRHPRQGPSYRVKIELNIPRGEIVVGDRNASGAEDVYAAIDESFDVALRALKEHLHKHRDDHPAREGAPHGRVVRLFPHEGYGFLEGDGGVEVYFHRNSVLHGGFDRLTVGATVRFVEELGERGPQASTVEIAST